jgi:acyl-CoA synthetase (AMP-forming)/AMP-acid ligase II
MNKEFLHSIQTYNTTQEGLESLYESLSQKEQECWDEIEELCINNWAELFAFKAKQTPDKIAIIEVDSDNSYTYSELEEVSNIIYEFIDKTIEDYRIGLNFHNGFLFVATLLGINKADRLAILFNNREPKHRQEELAQLSGTHVVFGNPIDGLEHIDINDLLTKKVHSFKKIVNYTRKTTLDDPAFVIFTSGTSGPSKGALFSHRRMIGAGIAWSLRTGMTSEDNCYISLPMYHGNGLAVAYSSVVYANATASTRIRFSVTEFFDDINRYKCSHMVYIGELWRYLINRYKENPKVANSSCKANFPVNMYLKVIFGNGLNKPLWEKVVEQFSIEHVVEHFGSTEMPAGALTNWFDIAGYCGYLPPYDPKLNEMVLVDENYHPVEYGKYGEALFLVPSGEYRGYLDSSLDESKLYRELFQENDLWWKSGDLLQSHTNGFYTFIERLGDTYRFKGENVACVDVEEAIRRCSFELGIHIKEIVVYGIELPNIDGKVGMASLVMDYENKQSIINELYKKIKEELASYAIPYFIKITKYKHTTTSTMKIQKSYLSKDGIEKYNQEEIYVFIDGEYEVLDQNMYNKIINKIIEIGK